nr:MAG: replication initiator protein [Microvirus sp.]
MCLNPIIIQKGSESLSVKCGKCYECLISKKKEWTFRLEQELKSCVIGYFLTLTYRPEDTPSFEGVEVLRKRDVQLFLKRLRGYYGDINIRFFCIGEYGPTTYRPHYHMLLFCSKALDAYLFKKEIERLWKLGFVALSVINPARIGYISGYMLPLSELSPFFRQFPPFRTMSQGIGRNFLTPSRIRYFKDFLNGFSESDSLPAVHSEILYKTYLCRYYKDRIFNPTEKAFLKYCFENDTKRKVQEAIRDDEEFSEFLNKLDDETRCKNVLERTLSVLNKQANRLFNAAKGREKMIKKRKI